MDNPLSLLHLTSLKNAKTIMKSGYIYTHRDRSARGMVGISGMTSGPDKYKFSCHQYDGVYFDVEFHSQIGANITYYSDDDVILVFCTSLLNRGDYHFNFRDQNGNISSDTQTSDEFLANVGTAKFQKRIQRIRELVFHHSVPLVFLREIRVSNKKTKDALMRALPSVCDYLIKVVTKIPNKTYICAGTKIKKLVPNMCFCMDEYARKGFKKKGFTEELEFYKKLARGCGVPVKELKKVNDANQLDVIMFKYVNKKFNL